MAHRKSLSSWAALLLLLLSSVCIAVAAGPGAEVSSCPFHALASRIQERVNKAWEAVGQRLWGGTAAEQVPQAQPWPEEFTISFTTKGGVADGKIFYDWANKRQLIWHGPGSTACEGYGLPSDQPCSILFNQTGIYVDLPYFEQCWLDTPGVGTVPPDWTVQGEYEGIDLVNGVGLCRTFGFPPTAHYYSETFDGRPCVFGFSSPDMTYYFQPDTEILEAPSDEAFELPSYCVAGNGPQFGPVMSVANMPSVILEGSSSVL